MCRYCEVVHYEPVFSEDRFTYLDNDGYFLSHVAGQDWTLGDPDIDESASVVHYCPWCGRFLWKDEKDGDEEL